MKTYNQSNTNNALKAKKQHKTLRRFRKRNGNTSLYEQSGEAKNTTHIEDELLAQYQYDLGVCYENQN